MELGTLKYSIIGQDYFQGQEVEIVPNCVDWIAINKGAVGVWVNGIFLKPFPPGHPELSGESFAVECNELEEFVGHLTIVFQAGANPWLQLVQRYYVKIMK